MMFDIDLLVAFAFMTLLFLRQVSISKQPNKINYAPLMIAIGAISSVIHFIMQPDVSDVIHLLRESFFPLLVSLLLYIVMNILHQTQVSQNARVQDEFISMLIIQMDQLKKFIAELEERMSLSALEDREAQREIREKFKQDINTLDAIQTNQSKFLDKFDDLESWHKDVSKEFEHFTAVQMPELDKVVHKHIDIFRVAETEHYHQLKKMIESSVDSKQSISDEMNKLHESMQSMKSLSDDIAKAITRHTLQQLSGVTKSFESEISALKSHAQGVKTSLSEGENTLGAIRVQSEMIMKQMVLSSTRMKELKEQNEGLYDIYSIIKELMNDIEAIKADYVKAQSQLSVISREFKEVENKQMEDMKKEIEVLSTTLSAKIDSSLLKLHEHYHIAEDDITDSVKILAKKAQLQKGYQSFES
jgi:chromosome segregation ATPase